MKKIKYNTIIYHILHPLFNEIGFIESFFSSTLAMEWVQVDMSPLMTLVQSIGINSAQAFHFGHVVRAEPAELAIILMNQKEPKPSTHTKSHTYTN